MSIPDGWRVLDFGGRFAHLETHFTEHVGPLFVRGEDGNLQIGFRVEPHMCNPAGICHGGMLMTVMDVGLAFALHNAMGQHSFTPSVSFNFDFVAPGKLGDFLICEGEVTRHTKSTGFVTGRLTGSDGPVITGSGIFKITAIKFDD
jgi:uncharacterized protein (TIGR00369 family)